MVDIGQASWSYSVATLLYLRTCLMSAPHRRNLPETRVQGEVLNPQYYTPLSRKRFPDILLSNSTEPMLTSPGNYFWVLADINAKEHPLVWDPEPDFYAS